MTIKERKKTESLKWYKQHTHTQLGHPNNVYNFTLKKKTVFISICFLDFSDDMMPPPHDMHEHDEYVVREEISQNNLIQDKGKKLFKFISFDSLFLLARELVLDVDRHRN